MNHRNRTHGAIVGARFGRLIILSNIPGSRHGREGGRKLHPRSSCLCDCGKSVVIFNDKLLSGKTRSCGCLRREATSTRWRTHGLGDTPEHGVWLNMIRRCTNVDDISFKNYGGRGIKVCERWLNSVENFLADVGKRPGPEYSLDRWPNNDGNYEPGNVRWATRLEQNANTRRAVVIEYQGLRLTRNQMALRFGIPAGVLYYRLRKGMSVSEAITTPNHGKAKSK